MQQKLVYRLRESQIHPEKSFAIETGSDADSSKVWDRILRYFHFIIKGESNTRWQATFIEVLFIKLYFCLPVTSTSYSSVQFSSVTQSCLTLCDPMNSSTPGLPVHHQFPEFTQTHVHWVSNAIQPSHPLSSPSPPAPNPSQHQCLFQWVNSSHEVAKVLEFQL